MENVRGKNLRNEDHAYIYTHIYFLEAVGSVLNNSEFAVAYRT